ncbi:hypothetical protein ACET3X_007573 [Alternaria dauci]|uniref:Uncharacterized protein n=1 Tax=Alternaria dauci TaxID=48095 RepID=A0ABR3UCB2_9PLEO
MLLIRTRCKHVVSLAALITILGLAFEPFFQQIVTYPDRMMIAGGGSTWAASTFIPEAQLSTRRLGFDGNNRDPKMTLAIDTVLNTPEIDMRSSTAQCSTANCTWLSYPTLGVGHTCQDVSYLLQYICENNTDLALSQQAVTAVDPCGYKVNDTFVTGVYGNLGFRDVTSLSTLVVDTFDFESSSNHFWNTTAFHNSTLPILDFYIAYTPGGPEAALRNQTPVLLECLLTWNVHTIDSRVVNGILQERVLDTVVVQPQSLDNSTVWPITASLGSNNTFRILNGSTQLLRDWILSGFPFYLSQDPAYDFELYSGMWSFHQIPPYDFESHMSNLTKAITNDMKSRSSGTMLVEGTAWSSERFVKIRWAWITLPAASLVGGLVLIFTMILHGKKAKAPVWKSSALTTLLHGLSEETRNLIDPDLSSSQVEAMSTKLRAKPTDKGEYPPKPT